MNKFKCSNCKNYFTNNRKSLSNHYRWCIGLVTIPPFLGKKHSKKSKKMLSLKRFNSNNPHWKGKKVGYNGLHGWIKRHKQRIQLCENCHKIKPYDLANISGKYKRDINDFKWLCRKCHMIEDGRLNNLRQFNNYYYA